LQQWRSWLLSFTSRGKCVNRSAFSAQQCNRVGQTASPKAGLLDEAAFESYVAGARYYMSTPGVRAAWRLSAAQFGPDFRVFVDDLIAKSTFAASIDPFMAWEEKLKVEIQRQHS
jgi:hypothetical protein